MALGLLRQVQFVMLQNLKLVSVSILSFHQVWVIALVADILPTHASNHPSSTLDTDIIIRHVTSDHLIPYPLCMQHGIAVHVPSVQK